ncbi:hypothetical protein B0H16DRAFT_1701436 [Mycena metata]|uniref:Uncharacterized protein n=1 Tax=Mycena metata TaxID=1033252 RepID=A0AAD7MGR4_9AGAR|nr:hypothetical protein B0H16DRAFT_1701436 [Mycena metata]
MSLSGCKLQFVNIQPVPRTVHSPLDSEGELIHWNQAFNGTNDACESSGQIVARKKEDAILWPFKLKYTIQAQLFTQPQLHDLAPMAQVLTSGFSGMSWTRVSHLEDTPNCSLGSWFECEVVSSFGSDTMRFNRSAEVSLDLISIPALAPAPAAVPSPTFPLLQVLDASNPRKFRRQFNVDVFKINMYEHGVACGYGEGEDGKGGEGKDGWGEGRVGEGRREGVGVSGYVGAAGIGPRKLSPHVCVGAGTHTTNARQRHLHACGVRAERGCECAPKNWHPVNSPACMCGRGDSTRTTNARSNVRTHTEFASAGASARKPHPVHGAGCTPLGVGAGTDAGMLREGGSGNKGGKEGGNGGRWDEGVCDGNGEERMRWRDGMRRELRARQQYCAAASIRRVLRAPRKLGPRPQDGDDDAERGGVRCAMGTAGERGERMGMGDGMGREPRYGSGIPTRRAAAVGKRGRELDGGSASARRWGTGNGGREDGMRGGWEEDAGEGNARRGKEAHLALSFSPPLGAAYELPPAPMIDAQQHLNGSSERLYRNSGVRAVDARGAGSCAGRARDSRVDGGCAARVGLEWATERRYVSVGVCGRRGALWSIAVCFKGPYMS